MFEEVEKKPFLTEEAPKAKEPEAPEPEFHVMPRVRPGVPVEKPPEEKPAPPRKPIGKKYYLILALIVLVVLGGAFCGIFIWYKKMAEKLRVPEGVTLENKELPVRPVCGDGRIQTPEVCDDGEFNGRYGYCNLTCTGPGPRCGDGTIQPAYEECDDGNTRDGDGCSAACKLEKRPQLLIEEEILLGLSISSDKDDDGLTDVEEEIYKTEEASPDTDGDGYPDGLEIVNVYSPLSGPGDRLAVSGLVAVYTNPLYRWSIFYPIDWLIDEEDDKVILDCGTGELISIAVKANPETLAAKSWYLKEYPETDPAELKSSLLTAEDSVWNPDRQKLYISKGAKIYVLSYEFGTLEELNFKSTFAMVIRSFKILR